MQTKTNGQEYCQRKQWMCNWDYQPGNTVLVIKDGILHKSESWHESEPWTITSVHTNGTIKIQHGTKSERLNMRNITPYFE